MRNFVPSFHEFRKKAKQGDLIPVSKEILADMETPVTAFYKINSSYAFLLESVQGGAKIARYSFLGSKPSIVFQSKGNRVLIDYRSEDAITMDEFETEAPLKELEKILSEYKPVVSNEMQLPQFCGGFVGYTLTQGDFHKKSNIPDSMFVLVGTILVFDHVKHKIKVVSNAHITNGIDVAYYEATKKIDNLIETLRKPLLLSPSQKDSFKFYRALRILNPSPYMYYLHFGNLNIFGSSIKATDNTGVVGYLSFSGNKDNAMLCGFMQKNGVICSLNKGDDNNASILPRIIEMAEQL